MQAQYQQTARLELGQTVGTLFTFQPQSLVHQAVHRVWTVRHRDRVLCLSAERDPSEVVQYHEGNKSPARQPPADALCTYPTGKVPSTNPAMRSERENKSTFFLLFGFFNDCNIFFF